MNRTSRQCFGSTWIDEDGVFYRDKLVPIYDEIDCIDIEQARWIRDNWLRMIRESRYLNEGMCHAMQLAVDDLDFLIRGGVVSE